MMRRSRSLALGRIVSSAALGLALALFGGCGAPAARSAPEQTRSGVVAPVSIAELGWLIGTWRGTGEGQEFFEQIAVLDDSTLSVVHFTDSTRTAIQPVTGTIEERAGRVYHTYGQARWVVTGGSARSLLFRPVEGADHRFRWTSELPTRRTTTLVRTDGLGREVTQTYTLKRLDADHTWPF